jgi:hypothetical protein
MRTTASIHKYIYDKNGALLLDNSVRQLRLLDKSHWTADETLAAAWEIMQMPIEGISCIFITYH